MIYDDLTASYLRPLISRSLDGVSLTNWHAGRHFLDFAMVMVIEL